MAERQLPSWEDSDLSVELQRLRSGLDDVHRAVEHALGRLDDLDDEAVRARKSLGAIQARAGDTDAALRDLTGLLKRLDARVEWLERNIRLSETASVVELDDVHADLLRLARTAETGLAAQQELLSQAARQRLTQAIDLHAEAGREHTGQLQVALAASLGVAETPHAGTEHAEAIQAFRSAVDAMDAAASAVRSSAGDAREAAQHLEHDDALCEQRADVIATGRQAWTRLQALLRRRLADAVGEGALLPTWFTTVLGPIPAAADTREWMEVGTELLAYRVSYQVSDPVVALGFEPTEQDSARRRAWHHRLKRQLREIQR
jgi:chromosome segregation ATPase